MTFSIIIPVHNAENRIHECLSWVACQTCKDYELICVCDSCSDNSADICREYTSKVYEVDYTNDGMARNKGLDEASGEWILFIDDDDHWVSSDQLQNLKEYLSVHNDADIIAFGFYFGSRGYVKPWQNGHHLFPNVWSKCWRKDFIGDTRFPNVYSTSDLEFCQLIDAKGPRYILLDVAWYYYNWMRPGSLTWEGAHNDRK